MQVTARHYCLGGFTQHTGRVSGTLRISMALEAELPPSHRVHPYRWDENWWEVAEYTWLHWQQHGGPPPRIFIYGYSRGGWGARQLARQFRDRGMQVEAMILCDPVLYGLSLWPFATLAVPSNVARVRWCYQRMNWPAGHRVVAEGSLTDIAAGVQLPAKHQYIDDSTWFRDNCLAIARYAAETRPAPGDHAGGQVPGGAA